MGLEVIFHADLFIDTAITGALMCGSAVLGFLVGHRVGRLRSMLRGARMARRLYRQHHVRQPVPDRHIDLLPLPPPVKAPPPMIVEPVTVSERLRGKDNLRDELFSPVGLAPGEPRRKPVKSTQVALPDEVAFLAPEEASISVIFDSIVQEIDKLDAQDIQRGDFVEVMVGNEWKRGRATTAISDDRGIPLLGVSGIEGWTTCVYPLSSVRKAK